MASSAVPHARAAESMPGSILDRTNLAAWCIVPFDAKKRGPEERAQMLDRLQLKHLAYDWRDEHIPTFDTEVEVMEKHGIAIDAWWFPSGLDNTARRILEVIKNHKIHPQLWITMGDPAPNGVQAEKVAAAARIIEPIADEAAKLGCKVALYNHGGWFGEPENEVAIIQKLARPNVGIVYNFHHGHSHIARFPQLFALMKPHLLALNLNGMIPDGEQKGMKIVPIGSGTEELAMIQTVLASGWRGPVGVLDHRPETDSEETVKGNLDGLEQLKIKLKAGPASASK